MEVISPAASSPDLFFFNESSTAPSSPTRHCASIFSAFEDDDFAFDSGRISPEISTADELFHNGKIRPFHPLLPPPPERGRKKAPFYSENRGARASRSLSPLRDPSAASVLPKGCGGGGGRKWRLKDLLLFRSASEGRAAGRNYALFPSFFYSSSSENSKKAGREDCAGGSSRRGDGRRPVISPHEIHYTANRAAAEEQRKKTPLAYERHGLFGFIQHNPAIQSIARGFAGNSSKFS